MVGSGHVSPRIWEITNRRFGEGADKCEICLALQGVYHSVDRSVESAAMKLCVYLTLSKRSCFL